VDGPTISCGVDHKTATESLNGEVVGTEVILRLPIETQICQVDRVRITHRHGLLVAEDDYELLGQPMRGPSGLVVRVKKVV
jgi:hypothetical protein